MKPRLRTILIVVNLVVLVLPFAGIGTLRLYDSELIRQTESSLIAQGAFVGSAYADQMVSRFKSKSRTLKDYALVPRQPRDIKDGMSPIHPSLDLSDDSLRAPAEPPIPSKQLADFDARESGEALTYTMQEAQRTTLAGIRVVDIHGIVVGSTRGELGQSLAHREEVKRALEGEYAPLLRRRVSDSPTPSLDSVSRRTRVRVFVAMPIWVDEQLIGAVVLSRTPLSLQKALYQNRDLFVGFLALILLFSLFISILTAFTIQRPISRLIKLTRDVEAGDTPMPLERPGTKEVEELSLAITTMATTLSQRADYIRDFARSVSHEFKSPITSLRGTVELLEDHLDTMSEEERTSFLAMLDHDAQRLERLVAGLLDLARADVAEKTRQTLNFREVVDEASAAESTDDFTVEVQGDFGEVLMREDAALAVISNLVRNAREAGATVCTIRGDVDAHSMTVRVTDDGEGIPSSNREKIFESFFTTKREAGGTGLGLAIVRSLVASVGGELTLDDDDETTFRLTVPLAT